MIDFTSRHAQLLEKAPQEVISEVLAIFDASIFVESV
jgi:hypothetical protein